MKVFVVVVIVVGLLIVLLAADLTESKSTDSQVSTTVQYPFKGRTIGYEDTNPVNRQSGKRQNELSPRILSGRLVPQGKYKWVSALIYKNKFFCGGTLVNDDTILTAAHCFPKDRQADVKSVIAMVGQVDIIYAENKDFFKGKQVIIHPKFKENPAVYDFALLKLERVVDFDDKNPSADSSCIPTDDESTLLDVNHCVVVGWGSDKYNVMRTKLMMSQIRLLNFYSCVDDLSQNMGVDMNGTAGRVTPKVILCGEGNEGVRCYGDSGSPLLCPYQDNAGFNLIGVVSFSKAYCKGNKVYFARIKEVTDWIKINAEKT